MNEGLLRRKEFKYKGRSDEELKAMTLTEFANISNTSIRRKIKRGLTTEQKNLLKKVKDLQDGKRKKPINIVFRGTRELRMEATAESISVSAIAKK